MKVPLLTVKPGQLSFYFKCTFCYIVLGVGLEGLANGRMVESERKKDIMEEGAVKAPEGSYPIVLGFLSRPKRADLLYSF